MRTLDLTKTGGHGEYRPRPEFLEYIRDLLNVKDNTDARELSDRAHDVCLSASTYELSGDEYNELYADTIIIDIVHPAMRDWLDVWSLTCWVEVREANLIIKKES